MIPKLFPQAIFGCIWYNILKIKKYMDTNAIIIILFGKRRILIPESSEKIPSSRWEYWTHDPSSSSLDAPTTEPLEALRQTGLKFNYYYKDSDVFFPLFISFYLRSSYGRSLVPLLSRPLLCCKLFITYHSDYIATVNLTTQTIKCTWQPPKWSPSPSPTVFSITYLLHWSLDN